MTITTKNQDRPLHLPSHERLSQEMETVYALAIHQGALSTRDQRMATVVQEHTQLIRYHALRVLVAQAEMEKIHKRGVEGLYSIAEHHDAINQAAREVQSKELSPLVEQLTKYDLESGVIHAQKMADIGFQNLAEILLQPITVPSEPEIIIKEVEVEKPGFWHNLWGG